MATGTLTGQTIANTYKSLLKVTGTSGGGETLHATTLKVIEDGDGNPSPIQLAQNRLEIVPVANHATAFEVSQTDGTQIFNINSTTPALTLTGALVVAGTTVDIDGSAAMQLNSSGGAISIGNDAVAQAMNIGTGAAARVITMGNVTGATQLVLNAGTAGIALASTGAGDITIDSDDTLLLDSDGALELNSSAGAINIGGDAVAQAIDIGNSSSARTITIGNTSSTATNLNALAITLTSVNALSLTDGTATFSLGGTGATSLSAATTVDLDCTGAMALNSSGSTINIGNDDIDQAINIGTQGERTISIGTGSFADEVVIGNTTGASGVHLLAGTGDVQVTGNLGIGVAAPDANLHVSGAGAQTVTIGSTNAGGVSLSLDGDSNGDGAGSDYCYIQHDTAGILNIVQDSPSGTNQIRFGTAGTEDKVTIDASGNLAIGNTSPASKLHVTGTVQVGVDGTAHDVVFYSDTAGDNFTWDASEEKLIITGTNGQTSLDVADGNVTIADDLAVDGTSNLDNTDIDGTLVVDGSNISLDSTATFNIDCSNTSNGVTIATATSSVPISIGHGTSETTVNDNLSVTGDLAVDGTSNLDNTDIDGTFTQDGGNVVFNEDSADYDFRVESNATANMLFVDGDTSVVGIGTATPVATASAYQQAGLHIHQAQGGSTGSQIHLTNATTGAAAGNGAHISMWTDDDLYITNQESDGMIKFASGGNADALVIKDDGNVGIGTAAPDQLLHVEGTDARIEVRASNEGGTANLYMISDQADDNHDYRLLEQDATGALNFNGYGTGSWVTHMSIDAVGNVGIGSVAPTTFHADLSGLQVGGNGILSHETAVGASKTFKIAQNVREEITSGDFTYISTDEASFIELNSGKVVVKTSPSGSAGATATMTERFTILQDGKVGINEAAPEHDLHVITSGTDDDGVLKIGGSGATLGLEISYDQSGATTAKMISNPTYTNTSALMHICVDGDANANQLVLKGDGNIGIGIADPAGKLEIHSAGTTSYPFIIDSTGVDAWGMYVLEDGSSNYSIYLRDGSGNTDILLDTAGVSYFNGGNVGIGNTAPGNPLEISTSADDANIEASAWSTTDAHSAAILLSKSASATINTLAATAAGERLGVIEAQGVNTSSARKAAALIKFEGDAAPDGDSVPGRIIFATSDLDDAGSPTERMRIEDAGNVGIGTTSPVTTLDVHSTGTEVAAAFGMADDGNVFVTTRVAETQNLYGAYTFMVGSAAVDGVGSSNTTAYISSKVVNDGGALAGDLQFYTNAGDSLGTAKMLIDKDGLVGIGTTAPAYPLDVQAAANCYIRVVANKGSDGTDDCGILFTENATNHWIVANDGGNSNRLNITDDSGDGVYLPQNQSGVAWSDASDLNLKTDISVIPDALTKVTAIRGVNFKWKKYKEDGSDPNSDRDINRIGCIAQEVNEVLPEAVDSAIDGNWGVAYATIIPLLIEAVKELSAKVTVLENA